MLFPKFLGNFCRKKNVAVWQEKQRKQTNCYLLYRGQFLSKNDECFFKWKLWVCFTRFEPKKVNVSTMCFSTELRTSLKIEKCQKKLKIDKYSHILPRVCLFPMKCSQMNSLTNLKHFTYPGHFHATPSSIFRLTLSYSTFFTDMHASHKKLKKRGGKIVKCKKKWSPNFHTKKWLKIIF